MIVQGTTGFDIGEDKSLSIKSLLTFYQRIYINMELSQFFLLRPNELMPDILKNLTSLNNFKRQIKDFYSMNLRNAFLEYYFYNNPSLVFLF